MTEDALTPWNDGKWRLALEDGVVDVARTNRAADVTLPAASLTSLYVGMHDATHLQNSGLLSAEPEVLAKLNRVFATRFAPHCPDHY